MSNPRMRAGDVAWSLLFIVIFLPLMVGSLVALFTFGGSTVANPASWEGKLLGLAGIMVAIPLSWLLSLFVFGLLTRRFLTMESHRRWQLQLENGSQRVSPLIASVGIFALKIVRPRHTGSP